MSQSFCLEGLLWNPPENYGISKSHYGPELRFSFNLFFPSWEWVEGILGSGKPTEDLYESLLLRKTPPEENSLIPVSVGTGDGLAPEYPPHDHPHPRFPVPEWPLRHPPR